jgi:hypothetical protein
VRVSAFDGAVEAARAALASDCEPDDLAAHIYATWYAAPLERDDAPSDLPDDLAAMLRAAHAGGDRWEGGWAVAHAAVDGRAVVVRDGEQRLLDRCDYLVPERVGIVASTGATVLAPDRRELLDADAGWWYTHHEHWSLAAPDGPLVRVYWNVGPGAVALLVQQVTQLLPQHGMPWMLKCAVDRESYNRADSAVLFLQRDGLERLRTLVDDLGTALADVLRAGAPPLTLRVAPGVAVADDPGTGESFGEHRCRLIAEGVLAAPSPDAQLTSVAERFREDGVPADRPYVSDASRSLPWE